MSDTAAPPLAPRELMLLTDLDGLYAWALRACASEPSEEGGFPRSGAQILPDEGEPRYGTLCDDVRAAIMRVICQRARTHALNDPSQKLPTMLIVSSGPCADGSLRDMMSFLADRRRWEFRLWLPDGGAAAPAGWGIRAETYTPSPQGVRAMCRQLKKRYLDNPDYRFLSSAGATLPDMDATRKRRVKSVSDMERKDSGIGHEH